MIDHDIHTIINGRFEPAMMDKYRKFNPLTYQALIEDPEELFPIDNSTEILNSLFEASLFAENDPAMQWYCYRVGFDAQTGKQVAIQFGYWKDPEECVAEIQFRYADLPEAKAWIEKYGDIDYRTDAFHVMAIFDRSGKPLKQVKFIGLLSHLVSEAIDGFLGDHPELTENGQISFATLFELEPFQQYLVDHLKETIMFCSENYEEYTVGEVCGYGTYKSTKLLWDRELLLSYQLTPIFRGYNDPFRDEGALRNVWLSDMLSELENATAKSDLARMRHLAAVYSELWRAMGVLLEQRFVFEALPGQPEIENAGEYIPNPPLEQLYFETMMRVNGTVINESYLLK